MSYIDDTCYDCNGRGEGCLACEGAGVLEVCSTCKKHLLQYGALTCNWCIQQHVKALIG